MKQLDADLQYRKLPGEWAARRSTSSPIMQVIACARATRCSLAVPADARLAQPRARWLHTVHTLRMGAWHAVRRHLGRCQRLVRRERYGVVITTKPPETH